MAAIEQLGANPFAVLTFIVAPAVLTNASSVMSLQTANRFSRAIDRARALSIGLEEKSNAEDAHTQLRLRQLESAERRALLLVRALTAFYVSVGAFAGASFTSLLGAIFVVADLDLLRNATLVVALVFGAFGIGGLLAGSGLLVWETRQALQILTIETTMMREERAKRLGKPGAAEQQPPNELP